VHAGRILIEILIFNFEREINLRNSAGSLGRTDADGFWYLPTRLIYKRIFSSTIHVCQMVLLPQWITRNFLLLQVNRMDLLRKVRLSRLRNLKTVLLIPKSVRSCWKT